MPLIRTVIKGIGSGIGLVSEATADRKERKAADRDGRSPSVSPHPQSYSSSHPPHFQSSSHLPSYGESSRSFPEHETSLDDIKEATIADDDELSSDDEDPNADRVAWALDDATNDLADPPLYENTSTDRLVSPDEYATSFLQSHHQILAPSQAYRPLSHHVILPQRRPKDKSRGFVRAYAPLLGECSGIDQDTFMDFLIDLDKASKSSPVFDVINVACFAVGFIPSPIAMGVSVAVQVVNKTAQELQSRQRRNTYLDQINEHLFKPRGLFCMIMTFKPDNPYDAVLNMDVSPHDQALAKVLSTPDSPWRQQLRNVRLTSGVAQGEMSLPEAAPLIYPALDAAAMTNIASLAEPKQSSLKSSSAFIASYLDRRAQATYAGSNPDSRLAVPSTEHKFASRYSDPNHPANSGTLLGLLTGGTFDPTAKKRVRKAERRAKRRGQAPLTEDEKKNVMLDRDPRKKKGVVKRALQKDVLYLAIVNLPSESEMVEIRQELEKLKNQQDGGYH